VYIFRYTALRSSEAYISPLCTHYSSSVVTSEDLISNWLKIQEMQTKRRAFMTAVGGVCLSAGAVTRARAQTDVIIEAEVRSGGGASLEGHEILFFSSNIDDSNIYSGTVRDGAISVQLPGGFDYDPQFEKTPEAGEYRQTGVPFTYGLPSIRVGTEDSDMGVFEVPEGHLVELQFKDSAGYPVDRLPIGFYAGTALRTGTHTTNADGFLKHPDNTETGVELSGSVTVEAGFRDSSSIYQLSINEPQDLTISVQDPEQYGGVVQTDDSTETETPVATDSAETQEPTATQTPVTTQQSTAAQATATTQPPMETQQSVADQPAGETQAQATDSGSAAIDGDTTTGTDGPQRGFLTNDPESSLGFLNDPVQLTWAGIAASIIGILAQLVGQQS
jgi:hypothetical protein